jgi:hypothetical protein
MLHELNHVTDRGCMGLQKDVGTCQASSGDWEPGKHACWARPEGQFDQNGKTLKIDSIRLVMCLSLCCCSGVCAFCFLDQFFTQQSFVCILDETNNDHHPTFGANRSFEHLWCLQTGCPQISINHDPSPLWSATRQWQAQATTPRFWHQWQQLLTMQEVKGQVSEPREWKG